MERRLWAKIIQVYFRFYIVMAFATTSYVYYSLKSIILSLISRSSFVIIDLLITAQAHMPCRSSHIQLLDVDVHANTVHAPGSVVSDFISGRSTGVTCCLQPACSGQYYPLQPLVYRSIFLQQSIPLDLFHSLNPIFRYFDPTPLLTTQTPDTLICPDTFQHTSNYGVSQSLHNQLKSE